ncbi:MAG: PBP1A family penicillin-binding protein [Candidatus Melainabacteria bacterium]|nr:PBP1A family penicillin-binding protein [Candidatus Melainabacteria bacterium]
MNNKYVFIVAFLIGVGLGSYLALPSVNRFLGLPSISNLTEYEPISSIEIYDYRDNFVGFLQGVEDRQVVPLSEISPFLKRAVLAIEDKDFYEHFGIDPLAIFRAFFVNLQAGRIVEGGSTITQQLVKNLLIPERERGRTFTRKIKELLLALEMERKVNKDKILELYLNQVFWGNRAYGIQRAAQRYFNKDASGLTLAESAYLAGLLKAPSQLSMDHRPAQKRKELVLQKMLEFGYITQKQYKAALKESLNFSSSPGQFELYPYYFSYILEQLKERFNVEQLKEKGYKVFTSLDTQAQEKAEKILNEEIKSAPYGINQYALCAIDVKTGQVRVLVGGVGDFWKHQWNRATNPHTIGSAFKPFIYLTAFELGLIDPDTKIKDSKIEIEDGIDMVWIPKNFDGKFWGNITIREALTFSRNLPAVKVAKEVGIEKVIETAKACGIESNLEPNLSLALGSDAITPLEAASAYSTFARSGIYIKPILIRRIEDPKKRIIENNAPVPQRAASNYATATLVSILQDVVKRGTGTLARLNDRPVAGKTGTSDKSRDVWFIGFTPDLSVAIWGGNDNNKPIFGKSVTGGAIVAKVWKRFCETYYEDKDIPPGSFAGEPKIKELLIDPLTGLLATPYTVHPVKKRFFPGTEPTEYAPIPPGAKRFLPFIRFLSSPFSQNKNKFIEQNESEPKEQDESKAEIINEHENELIEQAKKRLNIIEDELKSKSLQESEDPLTNKESENKKERSFNKPPTPEEENEAQETGDRNQEQENEQDIIEKDKNSGP